jgi:thiamine kinase-like enzyme
VATIFADSVGAPIIHSLGEPVDLISALPLWSGPIDIAPLEGGITNRNYVVRDGSRRAVVRIGGDIPVHGVMRFNEHAASHAGAAAGVSPRVLHAEPGLLVIDFIEGRSYDAAAVRADRDRCVALVQRAHREVARHLRGPVLSFNVFHIIRDYSHTLASASDLALLSRLAAAAGALERAVGPIDLVFAHNDLLPGNIIDDGTRLWLVDWDYAGFNTPLFDLGGLSSNSGFSAVEEDAMLAAYFDRPPDAALRRRLRAMVCASLLRETLWSMASEIHSTIDFDYREYTAVNLQKFERAWAEFQEQGPR